MNYLIALAVLGAVVTALGYYFARQERAEEEDLRYLDTHTVETRQRVQRALDNLRAVREARNEAETVRQETALRRAKGVLQITIEELDSGLSPKAVGKQEDFGKAAAPTTNGIELVGVKSPGHQEPEEARAGAKE